MNNIQNFYINNPYPLVGDHNKYFKNNIFPFIKNFNPRKILDAGCGTGGTTASISECFPEAEITAIDSSYTAIDIAKTTYKSNKNINFLVSDLNKDDSFEFEDKFDFINCHGVLHYFDNPTQILRNFGEIVSHTGRIHIWMFNPYGRKDIKDVMQLEKIFAGVLKDKNTRVKAFKLIRKYFKGYIRDEEKDRYWERIDEENISKQNPDYIRLANRYFLPDIPYYYSVESAIELFEDSNLILDSILDFEEAKLPNELNILLSEEYREHKNLWHIFELLEQPFGLSYYLKRK